ncbi:MAG TPA: divalent-cation tolerance protein CutA [Candidatus Korarchaeota archaeon]|nr:divalent-cation tolerance protein CutA [Candidatus Korarchaeota archaeon]
MDKRDGEPILVLSTAPNMESAKKIARLLVVERLAACASLIPGITSYYWWQEEVRAEEEVLILVKTSRAKFKDLELRLKEVHPYDIPEIVACSIKEISEDYLRWLLSEVDR